MLPIFFFSRATSLKTHLPLFFLNNFGSTPNGSNGSNLLVFGQCRQRFANSFDRIIDISFDIMKFVLLKKINSDRINICAYFGIFIVAFWLKYLEKIYLILFSISVFFEGGPVLESIWSSCDSFSVKMTKIQTYNYFLRSSTSPL